MFKLKIFKRIRNTLLNLPRVIKQLIVVSTDFLSCIVAVWLSYVLRLDAFNIPRSSPQFLIYILSPLLLLFAYWQLDVYKAIFRYSSAIIIKSLSKGAVFQLIGYSISLWLLSLFKLVNLGSVELPKSILILVPLLSLFITGGARAIAFSFLTKKKKSTTFSGKRSRLLIYGAGNSGLQAFAAIHNSPLFTTLGFIDDNKLLQGREIQGNRIFGFHELSSIVPKMGVTDIILAIPSLNRAHRFNIIEKLRAFPVHVRSLPSIDELASGNIEIQDLKELDVTDLLGRSKVSPDSALIAKGISNKSILVTGAGGSIGSELCRQILKANPSILILFDVSEYGAYLIEQELIKLVSLGRYGLLTEIKTVLGSVRDSDRVNEVIGVYKPDVIFHAAAYKHVPLVESNPFEGILNNVIGTQIVALAAMNFKVGNFVLISTDKAVRPTNIMGASKRLAELVLQAMSTEGSSTVYSMVRFGNVLGSSGSVVPLFRDQIRRGGPVTITDYAVTRYFMTIPEAAELVIQSCALALGGEVFVLDMGEPVKIYDLACKMIELSGLTVKSPNNPDGDIEIREIGLRPGEKLYEELLIGNSPMPTKHPRIMQAKESHITNIEMKTELDKLLKNIEMRSMDKIVEQLKSLVAGFDPDIRHLDSLKL